MSVSSKHALPMEHTPLGATLALLALASAVAVTGAMQWPRAQHPTREETPERATLHTVAPTPQTEPPPPTQPAPTPTPPAPTPLEAVVATPTPTPAPALAVTPDAPGCPPRWTVRFRRGSWSVPPRLFTHFASLRGFLSTHPRGSVLVIGYADPAGADRDNHALSVRRAQAVGASLRRAGVSASKITTDGVGAYTVTDDVSDSDALRRVEVRVRGVAGCHGASEEVIDP